MRRSVVWTDEATWDLTLLGQYLVVAFGLQVAEKVVRGIVDMTEMLPENPYMGVADMRHPPYRVFRFKRTSVYYVIRDNEIEITRILDNRQGDFRKNKALNKRKQ